MPADLVLEAVAMRFVDGVRELIEVDGKDFTALRKAAKAISKAIRDPDYGRGYYQPEERKVIWSLGDAAERVDGDGKIKGDYLRSFFKDAGVDAEIDVQPEGRPRDADGPGWFEFWPEVKALKRTGSTDVAVNFESLIEGWYQIKRAVSGLQDPRIHWTRMRALGEILRSGQLNGRPGKWDESPHSQISLTRSGDPVGGSISADVGFVFERDDLAGIRGATMRPFRDAQWRDEQEEVIRLPTGRGIPVSMAKAILVNAAFVGEIPGPVVQALKALQVPVYIIQHEFSDAPEDTFDREWALRKKVQRDDRRMRGSKRAKRMVVPHRQAPAAGRFVGSLRRVHDESAASDVNQKAARTIATSLKQGRGALDALRRISDADLLRAADETSDEDTPEPRGAPMGKVKDRVDPTKMASVRDEIEKRFKRLSSERGTETARRAIAHLVGALPDAEDEDASPEAINAIAGAADAQQRTGM